MRQARLFSDLLFSACCIPLDSHSIQNGWSKLDDPESFRRYCDGQGLFPTVYNTLDSVLGVSMFDPTYSWRGGKFRNRHVTTMVADELSRIQRVLLSAGIRCLAYKGVVLAQLLYGGLDGRPPGDIDILVPDDQAERAMQILAGSGYSAMLPGPLSPAQEKAILRFDSGRQFYSIESDCRVDLHWKLFGRWIDCDLDFDRLWDERRVCILSGLAISTLGEVDTLLLLALHGAQHRFQSFKHIVDIHRALIFASDSSVRAAITRAGHRGPLVEYAFHLATLLDRDSRSFGQKPVVWQDQERILQESLSKVNSRNSGMLDPHTRFCLRPTFTNHSLCFSLLRFLAVFVRPSVEDVSSVKLSFLPLRCYYFVRLVRLALKLVRRMIRLWGRVV